VLSNAVSLLLVLGILFGFNLIRPAPAEVPIETISSPKPEQTQETSSSQPPPATAKRLELNYPALVIIRGDQPVRILATLLEGDRPTPGVDVEFIPPPDFPISFDLGTSVFKTNQDGQAWVDFILEAEGARQALSIKVNAAGLSRVASFKVISQLSDAPSVSSLMVDTDNDGLGDTQEQILKTSPDQGDSDGDGVWDGEEFFVFHTSPIQSNIFHLSANNLPIRAPDITQAGRFKSGDVRLFNLGVAKNAYTWVFLEASVESSVVNRYLDGIPHFIDPLAIQIDGEVAKGTQFYSPSVKEVIWLEADKALPIVIIRELDNAHLLVRVFGLIETTFLKPGVPTESE
jgi:hypothetical protein